MAARACGFAMRRARNKSLSGRFTHVLGTDLEIPTEAAGHFRTF